MLWPLRWVFLCLHVPLFSSYADRHAHHSPALLTQVYARCVAYSVQFGGLGVILWVPHLWVCDEKEEERADIPPLLKRAVET